jgi:hypothetical protein
VSLAETQAALARLFTQTAARADFARDPVALARAAGLEGEDAQRLAALDAPEISRFARGLFAKRRQDVEKWLPLTARALGADFAQYLRETLAEPPPGARADALALVAKLRGARAPGWIGELAAYEGEFLRAWGPRAVFWVRFYRWPVPRIAAKLAANQPVGAINRGLALAVWLRPPGGRLWHWSRTLP